MTAETETMRNHWWWRPGWSVGRRFYTWHLTFAGQTDVHRLARQYRTALAPSGDALTPIPDRWLHLTMQGVGFVGEVDEEDVRASIRAAIGDVLPEVPEKQGRFTPHVSVAYSAGDGPAQPISQALTGVDPTPARAHISSAELIGPPRLSPRSRVGTEETCGQTQ